MKLNRELLRKVARKLRGLRHEEHYDQSEVINQTSCGTAACIGGWAVILAPGVKFKVDERYGITTLKHGGKEVGHILSFARRQLGITPRMAGWLFSGGPTAAWPYKYAVRLQQEERPSRVAADLLDAIADGKVKPGDGNGL